MLKNFDGESDTPELIWDSSMRAELRTVIAEQLDACLSNRKEGGNDAFALPSDVFVKYKNLVDELYIGGVYLSRFLKEPTYNLRDPTTFLEMVMQRWTHEIQTYFSNEISQEEKESSSSALVDANQDILQLVTSACVYQCKVRDSLCDKLGQWGYMERSMTFLDEILGRELYGSPLLSVMRLLHVASNRLSNVESICVSGRSDGKNSIVSYTMQAIGQESLHPDTAFMVEMLKKVFTVALGDLKKAKELGATRQNFSQQHQHQHMVYAGAPSPAPGEDAVGNYLRANNDFSSFMALTMAPSPAPGEGFVDDPLAMFRSNEPPQGQQNPAQQQQQQMVGVHSRQIAPPFQTNGQQGGGSFSYQNQSQQGAAVGQMQQQGMAQSQQFNQGFQPQMGASFQSRSAPNNPLSSSGLMQGLDAYGRSQTPQGLASSVHSIRSNVSTINTNRQRQTPSQQSSFQTQQPFQQRAQKLFGASQAQPQQQQQQTGIMNQQMQMQQPQYSNQQMQQPQFNNQQIQQPHYQNQQSQQVQYQYQQPQQQQQQQQPQLQQTQAQVQQPQLQASSFGQSMPQHTSYYQQQPAGLPVPAQPVQQQFLNNAQAQHSVQQTQQQPFMQQQQQQPFMQPQMQQQQIAPQFQVETVSDEAEQIDPAQQMPVNDPVVQPQYRPDATVGSGIDARTKPDPKVEAEQQAVSLGAAPGAANGRVALLQSALVNELPKFLLENVLENPTMKKVKDPAATKVHTVELLKLLTEDPGYGMKFKLILDELPAWKNYKSQDHSLFITGVEQKADYFLTDGSSGEPVQMLTQG